jgi:RNA polymerase-binding transcription factor DksA
MPSKSSSSTAKAKSPKAPFTAAEMKKWRTLLVEKRQELFDDIDSLEKSAMDVDDGHIAPTHQADRGSDADTQETNLRLAENEKILLWQIDRAIVKIDTGGPLTYGLCEHTQKPIPKTRLQLLPWTPLSIEGAEYMESEGLTLEDMLIDN